MDAAFELCERSATRSLSSATSLHPYVVDRETLAELKRHATV